MKLVLETISARRREDVRALRAGRTVRRVPVRIAGMRDLLMRPQADRIRGPGRGQRALPSRPDQERHGRRLHRLQARPRDDRLRSSRCSNRSCDETYGVIVYQEQVMQDRERSGRLFARRSRPAAQGHGEEEARRRWPSSASASSTARTSAQHQAQNVAKRSFRPDGAVCGLRLQQVALGRVRRARLRRPRI